MSELVKRDVSALAVSPDQTQWDPNQRAALVQIGVDEASDGDLAVFLNYAQRTGLDPFSRQIYMIGRYDSRLGAKKWTIQASIDGLRIIAQRSGEYAGQVGPEWCGPDGMWKDVWINPHPPTASRVGVLRKGFAQPLYAVALLNEYAQMYKDKLGGLWGSKPAVMLAKCAEALALRKAFPMDLSGIYTAEEMSQADSPQPVAHPSRPDSEVVQGEVIEEEPSASSGAPDDWWSVMLSEISEIQGLRDFYNKTKTAPTTRGVPADWANLINARAAEVQQAAA